MIPVYSNVDSEYTGLLRPGLWDTSDRFMSTSGRFMSTSGRCDVYFCPV